MRTIQAPTAQAPANFDVARTRAFIETLIPPPRNFSVRLWEGTEIGGEEGARYTLVINSPGAARRMFALPVELALGEAFIFGDFDIEGDLADAIELKDRLRATVSSSGNALRLLWRRQRLPRDAGRRGGGRAARLQGRVGTRDRARNAVQHHYDVGNDFYSLWLDRRMVYSCAYFPTGAEDLDRAQELKLDLVCRKLRLREGERFLDIGCGWGALCIHAAQRYGVRALGVTLSEEQLRLARARVDAAGLADRVEIRLADYRDLAGSYDRIASIGMFEHVKDHDEYFGHVHRLLAPRGLFLNHAIASPPGSSPWGKHSPLRWLVERYVLGTGSIRERYVFPDGNVVPVSDANIAAERAGLEVRDVENLREHYARTLRFWAQRLEARREEALRVTNEFVFRTWRIYLNAAPLEFERGRIGIAQTLFAKPDRGDAGLPWSRGDLYG
jgi:cyclopropane-fatty-acyl-phospholipid synthase